MVTGGRLHPREADMSYTLTPATERRVAPRFRPTVGTVCRLRDGGQVGLVWNISRTGISMMMADPPPAGTVMAAELTGEGSREGLPLVLHVVHVKQADTGDYLLGARFETPLDWEQMRQFLAADAIEG
jgi:hypothetical protein